MQIPSLRNCGSLASQKPGKLLRTEVGQAFSVGSDHDGSLGLPRDTFHFGKGSRIGEHIDGLVGNAMLPKPCLGHVAPGTPALDIEDHHALVDYLIISLLASERWILYLSSLTSPSSNG